MIKRLRWKMAGFNALIAGTILIVLTIAALLNTDNMLVAQFHRNLDDSASSFYATIGGSLGNTYITYATKSDCAIYFEEDGHPIIAGEVVELDRETITKAVVLARSNVNEELEKHDSSMMLPDLTEAFTYQRYLTTQMNASYGIEGLVRDILASENETENAAEATNAPVTGFSFSFTFGAQEPESTEEAAPQANADGNITIRDAVAVFDLTDNMSGLMKSVTYRLPEMIVDVGAKSYRVAPNVITGDTNGMFLIFQDRTEELAARSRLRQLFFGCALIGLLLTGIASLIFSKKAVRPIALSIEQQKAFVASASHELRSPVAALSANVEVLQDVKLGGFQPFLNAIKQETERMGHLVSDLIDLARADAGVLSIADDLVDVEDTVLHTIEVMRSLAVRNELELTAVTEPGFIRGDASRLCQVLIALIDNAIRYTGRGGHVRLSVAHKGQSLVVAVADDGPGIPDAYKLKVFERFYRMNPAWAKDGGSGLGLCVAKQIVEQMQGTISLRDGEGGKGCVFEIKWKAESSALQALTRTCLAHDRIMIGAIIEER